METSMFPPSQSLSLDLEALSGICGSVSIACWIVVFSPQIVENFRRSSAEGLSVVFVVVWLVGDVFNILGAVLQGVLPTMIILAVYYTLADIVLLLQCFYYRGFTLSDEIKPTIEPNAERRRTGNANETSPLLSSERTTQPRSSSATRRTVDATHLSPATPLHRGLAKDVDDDDDDDEDIESSHHATSSTSAPSRPAQANGHPSAHAQHRRRLRSIKQALFNLTAVLVVCAAGVLGWWLSPEQTHKHKHHHKHTPSDPTPFDPADELPFNTLGQVFGYTCAILYLGSRVPQLLLNYRRQSTEGISMLFFLFACVGNLTYVLSIFAFDPAAVCRRAAEHAREDSLAVLAPGCPEGMAAKVYARYILVNLSWLIGSAGTLFLDAAVFVQYFMYKKDDEDEETR